jgi:hypothetical protein
MARGGTKAKINPAQLHASRGGSLEVHALALLHDLVAWTERAWQVGHAAEDDVQLRVAALHALAHAATEVPEPLAEHAVQTVLGQLRVLRESGTPRELRPALRQMHAQGRDYLDQVGWTLPAQMEHDLRDQMTRRTMVVDDPALIRLARMRAATSLLAAIDTAPDTGIESFEILRSMALAGADEAWARTRSGHDAPLRLLEGGRLYLALAGNRSARIRQRRLEEAVAPLRAIARSDGSDASLPVVTVPDSSWIRALKGDSCRPYIVRVADAVVVGPEAYQDLRAGRASARMEILYELLRDASDEAESREQRIVADRQVLQRVDSLLRDAQMDEDGAMPWAAVRQLPAQLSPAGTRARTWHGAIRALQGASV